MYTSAFSIFSGGSSLKWVRETICKDLEDEPAAYRLMDGMASKAAPGSGGLIFNPSLAGGTSQDRSIHIKGAYLGLRLGTTREEMIRAAMEGIALNLKMSYDFMKERANLEDKLMICGGGSKSPFWLQMFADVFGIEIIKTSVDQDAASLGAGATAARAIGLWRDYSPLDDLLSVEHSYAPSEENVLKYRKILEVFRHTASILADLGDYMRQKLE
jgi:xylulokinase